LLELTAAGQDQARALPIQPVAISQAQGLLQLPAIAVDLPTACHLRDPVHQAKCLWAPDPFVGQGAEGAPGTRPDHRICVAQLADPVVDLVVSRLRCLRRDRSQAEGQY
jgi:hypothetical protein